MKYNINSNNLSQVFLNIEKELKDREIEIEERLAIDFKYSKMKVSLEMLEKVVNTLKDEKLDINQEQKGLIRYNGNPCITLNLCILAILTKTIIILDFNNYMIGINKLIIEMINEQLYKYKTDELIFFIEENKQVKELNKIICIDDINKYNSYLRQGITNAKFYSYEYIDFYYDNEELEDLIKMVYQYAESEQIPIESYSELDLDNAVKMIQNGIGAKILLLTNSNETKKIFRNNIKNKKIYINKMPFEKEIKLINKNLFYI